VEVRRVKSEGGREIIGGQGLGGKSKKNKMQRYNAKIKNGFPLARE